MSSPTPKRLTGDLAQVSTGATGGTQNQLLGLMEWAIDVKLKKVEGTTTDDAGAEYNLTSTRSWSATAKFAYIDGDQYQLAEIINQIGPGQTPVPFNFFVNAEVGRGAWVGNGLIDGYKISGGIGKMFQIDATITGAGALTWTPQIAPTGNQAKV